MKCDGRYSEDEYQALEMAKQELQKKVREAQDCMAHRAQQFVKEMAREQRLLDKLNRQLDCLYQRQSDMVARACSDLDALDAEDGHVPDEPEGLLSDIHGALTFDEEPQFADFLSISSPITSSFLVDTLN